MVTAIPGARGLFSTMQEALRHEKGNRVRLRGPVHHFLQDFRVIAADLTTRPTRITELIPGDPVIYGAVDAAGTGMGGVLFLPPNQTQTDDQPVLWRAPFPSKACAATASHLRKSYRRHQQQRPGTGRNNCPARHNGPEHGYARAHLTHLLRQHSCRSLA
jgi:hypothetical protein